MAIYLRIDGVDGDVTAAGYEKCIKLTQASFGAHRPVSMDTGSVANRVSSTPTISTMSLSKELDESSPKLFGEVVGAANGKDLKIHFVRSKGDAFQEFLTYELSGCVVSDYSVSAVGGENEALPTEQLALSFTKVLITHTSFGTDDATGSPMRAGYDLTTAKAI